MSTRTVHNSDKRRKTILTEKLGQRLQTLCNAERAQLKEERAPLSEINDAVAEFRAKLMSDAILYLQQNGDPKYLTEGLMGQKVKELAQQCLRSDTTRDDAINWLERHRDHVACAAL